MKSSMGLGKYRDLVFAILLFIVLDLGILMFNFFASIQLERDAGRINSAGELRMLTQQITKSMLTLQLEKAGGLPTQTSMAQLNQGHAGFVRAQASLFESLNSDWEFRIFGLDPAVIRESMQKLDREWKPLDEAIRPVIDSPEPKLEDIEIAVNKSVARNIRLMGLSDDLANIIQAAAGTKTERMRQVQVAAIVLALLNFVYIVFKFLRRLNASDQVASAARSETDAILGSVSEGLMLVHADGTVGTQVSASVHKLLMRRVEPGQDFYVLMDGLLGEKVASEARSYLQLLFDPKVKASLLSQLDPLREVQVSSPKPNEPDRYLTFKLVQVREGGAVKELLVTLFDVTQKVLLERELALTQDAARSDVEDLIRVLEQEPLLLQEFLLGARAKLTDLNQAMREVGRKQQEYVDLVQQAARQIHSIKGESAALSLTALSRQAHRMEDVLQPLLGRADLEGEELIPVVLELSKVQEQVDRLYRVFDRVGKLSSSVSGKRPVLDAMLENLESLSQRVAQSLSKRVKLTAHIRESEIPEEVASVLREALPQLIRNAVVHGIESPHERVSQGKPETGELRLEIGRGTNGQIEVTVSDDGRGIVVPAVRHRASQLRPDAARLSDSQVLGLIFDQSFSTATEVTEHAGRGVGLALVRQIVEKAGARLRVMTQPQSYTRFVLQFGAGAR